MSRAHLIKLLKIVSFLAMLILAGPYTVRAILAQTLFLPIVMRAEATPTPTPTLTPTPTQTPTLPPTPMPIVNPSFEQGETGWVFGGDAYVSPVWAWNGIYSAVLGDGEPNDFASIAQQFTVPHDAYNLRYYQYTNSLEPCTPINQDYLIFSIDGDTIDIKNICSGLNGTGPWVLNLVDYRGDPVVFRMEFYSNGINPSWVYVDNFGFIP